MSPRRTLLPAAARLGGRALVHGLAGWVVRGRYLRRFEADLREYLGQRHVFLASSGRAALALTLTALARLSDRREVLIPAYTCFSVPAAIRRAGLEVALADVDPLTLDFDTGALERAVTGETLAVVTTHLFGRPADRHRAAGLCRARGAFLVEDAAQALGIRDRDGLLGTAGDVGLFSFDRGKNVTSGSGGAVVTASDRIAAVLRETHARLPVSGRLEGLAALVRAGLLAAFARPSLYWLPASLPWLGLGQTVYDPGFPMAQLSGVAAGLLHGWRARLAADAAARTETTAGFVRDLSPAAADLRGPLLRFPLLARSAGEQQRICAESARDGLGVGRMYPTAVSEIPALRAVFRDRAFPGAATVADRLVTLPTHRWVSARDRQRIGAVVASGADHPVEAVPVARARAGAGGRRG